MKIYLIRHSNYLQSNPPVMPLNDVPLTAQLRLQIKQVSKELSEKKIEKIITSPLNRAFQTAKILSDTLSPPIRKKQAV